MPKRTANREKNQPQRHWEDADSTVNRVLLMVERLKDFVYLTEVDRAQNESRGDVFCS